MAEVQEVNARALDAVARELAAVLGEARNSLESAAEAPDDGAALGAFADLMHSARGVLRIIEVYGASLLAEEMELSARALARSADPRQRAEGLDGLMRAAVQLPAYVERVLGGGRDLALVLLPLLNDLRAVRGAPLLSEGTLLSLNLTSDEAPATREAPAGEPALTAAQWARRLRPRFQVGLLGLIRDARHPDALPALREVAEKMEAVATSRPLYQLWWVVGSILEALAGDGLEESVTLKRLLGQADRELRRLYEVGEERYAAQPPLDLLNNFLYYVARARSDGPRIAAVRESFRLGELLPVDDAVEQERESLSAPSVKLMHTVAAAIREDLGRVKDALDLYARKGGQPEELAPQAELLKKIGDTLAVLGLGSLREQVQDELGRLGDIVSRRTTADADSLIGIASVLINVEDNLDESLVRLIMPPGAPVPELAQDPEFRQVAEAVLRECSVNLARIKELVAQALEPGADLVGLDSVQPLARGIAAGLLMLGKARATELITRIGRAVGTVLRPQGAPATTVDRLADAIVSVEYYMETLQAGRSDPWYMLDNAERCLGAVEAALAAGASPAAEAGPAAEFREPAGKAPEEAPVPVPETELPVMPEATPPPTQVEVPAETAAAAEAPVPTAAVTPVAPSPAAEELDAELLPVFVEEAREEADVLRQVFPLWDTNPADQESLARVRRAFHTLKGSGRMVGAMALGQFAWSMENLLNRLIDGTRERTQPTLGLLRDAVAVLPGLVDGLERREPMPAAVAQMAAAGFAIAEGREPLPYRLPEARAPGTEPTLVVERPDEEAMARMLAQVPPVETEAQAAEAAAPQPAAPAGTPAGTAPAEAGPAESAYEPTVVLAKPGIGAPHDAAAAPDAGVEPVAAEAVPEAEEAGEAEAAVPAVEEAAAVEMAAGPSTLDMSLQDIYRREVQVHVEVVREFLRRAWSAPGPHPVSEDLYRACHTLRGASRTARVEPAIQLADPLHRWLRRLFDHDRTFTEEGLATLADSVAAFEDILDRLDKATMVTPAGLEDVVGSISSHDLALERELATEPVGPAAEAVAEAEPEPEAAVEPAAEAVTEPEPRIEIDHLIPGIVVEPAPDAAPAGFDQLLPPIEETPVSGPVPYLAPPEEFQAPAERAEPAEEPAWASDDYFGPADIGGPHATEAPPADAAPPPVESRPAVAPAPPPAVPPPPVIEPVESAAPVVAREAEPEPEPAPAGPPVVDYDPDIAAIFCEEATELLESADAALGALRAERGSRERVVELQRVLHTLKGGARMAGVAAMGDLSHELESLLLRLGGGSAPLEAAALDVVQATLDELSRMRDFVSAGRPVAHARDLITRIRLIGRGIAPSEAPPAPAPEPPAPVEAVEPEEAAEAEAVVEAGTVEIAEHGPAEAPAEAAAAPAPVEAAAALPGREAPAERAEMARVDAELLDAMLNNAGEASIFRARLEQQLASVDFNLAELGRVVQRLKDQLRKLEIETEAQILHRHVDAYPRRDDFDPLELDRYSTIQQYSRALAETASDVASVQGLLGNLTREAQNLLVQQGRVISDLQNGLMRTRMVPFQRHVQRLTRIVRQVAAEYGKRAELAVTGAAGELDRQVLERMLPPFEHLLRNAVVHGIEAPEERDARGKPATGSIQLSLRREGAEVVIVVADDGGGIPLRMVRDRAVALGLITPKQDLTDDQALQLILEPGFSTATRVTQSAGRGVGMDVVATEIKKLGGSLYIESEEGKGTRFTIRLPFTLAISHALVVRVGEELFALPMPTVEGVVRVPVEEVRRQLAGEAEGFDYGGQRYRFRHLAGFVGGVAGALPEHETAVPVIMVRAGEHSTGIVADELAGSREIVVKSVGPQIAGIRGIAGATILGDGRICIILDVPALVRSDWRARAPAEPRQEAADRRAFALVVDDSITVRRVTQRLLERNGLRVMTAKDGLDAVGVLQEHVPDVILLDIEMPRMDGYEVASHVRNDPRLKDVPIVMITSRVGEKHRARAIELGVNEYLGKPYQESQLLEALEPLLKRRRAS